ncbi:MAG: hypothetical protein J4215_01305 [Candidatus Diapherotrites archaeon]|uniref:Uncharacterized protein n=1 Tax=Candidatus Iainarchaeum sp. TaxID=3101447 RepID=A0A8T4L5R7_9ARCH|nr:hypothetical protein [Candidatus Diapherotrites archaeon]
MPWPEPLVITCIGFSVLGILCIAFLFQHPDPPVTAIENLFELEANTPVTVDATIATIRYRFHGTTLEIEDQNHVISATSFEILDVNIGQRVRITGKINKTGEQPKIEIKTVVPRD